jgi:hypothetical protein
MVDDPVAGVYVAAFERDPLLRPEPVSRANSGIGANVGWSSSETGTSWLTDSKVGTSRRLGSGFGTSVAGFSTSSLTRTAKWRTWRSVLWIAPRRVG